MPARVLFLLFCPNGASSLDSSCEEDMTEPSHLVGEDGVVGVPIGADGTMLHKMYFANFVVLCVADSAKPGAQTDRSSFASRLSITIDHEDFDAKQSCI